ncbi:MAG: hypothetical protein LJE91_01525 [Gammaproteobacteria bacterium]|jgi:hypothetical protein|nr:hypothetical protein [Gammaproteobacteria bacterium]
MHLDFWNVVTFLALLILLAGFTVIFVWFISLPGKLAVKRKHPHAEAVKLMGNLGFLGGVPWLHALMWAIHDSVTIDIRRLPKEERDHIEAEIAALRGEEKKKIDSPGKAADRDSDPSNGTEA